jgi:hypothetical protein
MGNALGVHAIDDLLQARDELLRGGAAGDVVRALVEDDGAQAGAVQHVVLQADQRRRAIATGNHAIAGDGLVGNRRGESAVPRMEPPRQDVRPPVVLVGRDDARRREGPLELALAS